MADEKEQPLKMGKYPCMVYEPDQPFDTNDPVYKICNSADEIPEGWVDNLSKCTGGPNATTDRKSTKQRSRKQTNSDDDSASGGEGQIRTDEPTESGEGSDGEREREQEVETPTLASLEVTRDEAKEILTEEGVKFAKNATDDKLAELLAPLLEDEDE